MHDTTNVPPVLDYAPPLKRRLRSIPQWVKAVTLVGGSFALGCALGTDKGGLSMLALPFVWGGGVWYMIARLQMMNGEKRERQWRMLVAAVLMLLAPFVLVHHHGDPSTVADMFNRGWNAKYVSPEARGVAILCLVLVGIYGLMDVRTLVRNRAASAKSVVGDEVPPSSSR